MPFVIPIPDIKWTFEQLLKLLEMDYATRKDRFEKIFEPTYLTMIAIHKDYNNMFNNLLHVLPLHNDEKNQIAYITKFDNEYKPVEYLVETVIGSKEYIENIKFAKIILDRDREENDPLRIQARAISAKIVKKGHNKRERKFSWALLEYFLDKDYLPENEEQFFEELIIEGPDKILDTPSHLVSEKIFEEPNSEKIRTFIKEIKLNINDKFTNIGSAYADLKLATYN
jgi:hypothetical protein